MKRRLFQLGLLLVLGAIVNVAVAWGYKFQHIGMPGGVSRLVDSSQKIAAGCKEHISNDSDIYFEHYQAFGYEGFEVASQASTPEWWASCMRWGIPLPSLECAWYWRGSKGNSSRWVDGIRIKGTDHVLPIRPIWPGFAINTIFYAAILWGGWAVFFVPGKLRRAIRRRRGQCPACAYPRWGGGTSPVCTECGTKLS